MKKEKPTYEILRDDGNSGLEILYRRYGRKLFLYAAHSWQIDEDENWEIVYDTLIKVSKKASDYHFSNEKKFSGFLFTVFCNNLRSYYRKKKRLESELEISLVSMDERLDEDDIQGRIMQQKVNEAMMKPDAEEEAESRQMQVLKQALESFEDWERILLLQRAQGVPYTTISRFTGKTPDQLKVYYFRLKKRLEQRMEALTIKEKASNEA